jgi:phosphatidylserine decarboxylase
MTFAREGWPFVLPFVALAALLLWLGHPAWSAAALVAGLLVLLFFRNPNRSFAGDAATVLAAADGLVTAVDEVNDPAIGPGPRRRVVTFLSVFDIHVQRVPVAGEVVVSTYQVGKKVAAFRQNAGEVNEQHLTVIRRPNGDLVGVRQIAGLLARRVVCYLKEGDQVHRGQAMGLIKFGSRVDLLLPASYRVLVEKGDRLKNGATPAASPPATDVAALDPQREPAP